MSANADVEGVLADFLDHVLVAANAGSLQSLAGDLLVLHGQQVGTQRELINASLLAAHVKDADLGICCRRPPMNWTQQTHSTPPPIAK